MLGVVQMRDDGGVDSVGAMEGERNGQVWDLFFFWR